MKTKLLLLIFVLAFSFASSCEPDDQQVDPKCDCLKTYYIKYPAMGSGSSYAPEHYDVVSSQSGKFNCDEDANSYVPYSTSNTTHYKIECD